MIIERDGKKKNENEKRIPKIPLDVLDHDTEFNRWLPQFIRRNERQCDFAFDSNNILHIKMSISRELFTIVYLKIKFSRLCWYIAPVYGYIDYWFWFFFFLYQIFDTIYLPTRIKWKQSLRDFQYKVYKTIMMMMMIVLLL